ncbi:uncharacterized protein A1O9_02509 [Exophiala aquamarina CBS 119918]|uniref:Magnesium transporter NIPA n=1 Tax=Exophiala aquamarina CBS 119918 TaxID=1182545 RepID=A0A072PZ90_9EURO|nr:uncharacterized protein A1O9_02509 [Exophiala aquamarina CBS 119918]KEF60945.1 hypothetical protein A1O9_02509 [Exophiala aquamarina CBS 119918]
MHISPSVFGSTPYPVYMRDGAGGGGGSQLREWSSFIGIVTAIVGNLLISFALNTQRYAHIRIDREHKEWRRSGSGQSPKSKPRTEYGATLQEDIAEERSRINLGGASWNRTPSVAALEPSLQAAFEPRKSKGSHEKDEDDDQGRESYLKSPYWWLGLILMIIGEAGNFLAYGFAPASIVSPLGVVALISNCLIAPLMLKEHFRKRDFGGVLVAVAGAVTVVLSASSSEEKLGPGELLKTIKRWEFLLYVVITCLLIAGLLWASPRYGRKTILVDLGLVGLFGGYTALSTKGVASLLSTSLYKAFTYPILYFLVVVLVASALMQIRYLNRALQNYDSTQVIPTQFVLFTLSVIIGSAVLYRDFEHTGTRQAMKFITGCFLTFFGVYLITSKRSSLDDIDPEDANEDEIIQLINEEAEDINEQTPLKRERDSTLLPNGIEHNEEATGVYTPHRPSTASSSVPSIAVTPAAEPWEDMHRQPWSVDTPDGGAPPRTPQIGRIQAESGATPFFTPGTSKPLHRTASSPANPSTPVGPNNPGPPNPDPLDSPYPEPGFLKRSARGSISRLLPGPLMAPLSSSLSALVADSILKGEGASRSARARIRRTRSARHHSEDDRRRFVPVDMDDNPLNARSAENLSRQNTRDTMPLPGLRDAIEEEEQGPRKTRLRALSETLSGMMARGKGKGRENYHYAPNGSQV